MDEVFAEPLQAYTHILGMFIAIVRIEFSPTEYINDSNGHYSPLETTDRAQLEVTPFAYDQIPYRSL